MASDESEQVGLDRFVDPDSTLGGINDYLSGLYGRIRNRVQDVGLNLDWWGESPFDVDSDDDVWVYQYVVAYSKGDLGDSYAFDPNVGANSVRKGSPSPEIQFKTGIYVLGQPTEDLERRFREVDNPRLVTLFDTREYAGYMTGFGFSRKETYIQREAVSAREVEQKGYGLGVPWFEVEAYDEEGNLEGYADGFLNPFTTETTIEEWQTGAEPPQQEIWRVRTGLKRNRGTGGQWEIGPTASTKASKRVRSDSVVGKDVYIGPFRIGTVTSRGTVWLRREYGERGGEYDDKATIISRSGIPSQALQKGARLYKYRETDSSIHLSTTRPPTGYQPVDPEAVDPNAVGVETGSEQITEILLDDYEPTQFTVETDDDAGRLLGLYNPPVVRDIENGTELVE